MRVIGITGGIGTGKSTVTAYIRKRGKVVLDADEMARKLTAPGGQALPDILRAFGSEVFFPDGTLDRKRLAALVFCDAKKKAALEEVTTKRVLTQIDEELTALRSKGETGPVFVDAPLLYETGADRMTDLVWLVSADAEVRIARVMERDKASREEVTRRMENQMPEEEKRRRAAEILDNSKGKEELYHKVEVLLEKYAETK